MRFFTQARKLQAEVLNLVEVENVKVGVGRKGP